MDSNLINMSTIPDDLLRSAIQLHSPLDIRIPIDNFASWKQRCADSSYRFSIFKNNCFLSLISFQPIFKIHLSQPIAELQKLEGEESIRVGICFGYVMKTAINLNYITRSIFYNVTYSWRLLFLILWSFFECKHSALVKILLKLFIWFIIKK